MTKGSTQIRGRDLIRRVAKYYHAKVVERRHPGHRMAVKYIIDKPEFKVGEHVTAKLQITNSGGSGLEFFPMGPFVFAAELGGRKLPSHHVERREREEVIGIVRLKPGESYEIGVDLSDWFNFTESGIYNLQGSFSISIQYSDAADSYSCWSDNARGGFTVKISDTK
jgi:hypothetical protein